MCQKATTPAKVNDQWDSSLIEDRCYFLSRLSNAISPKFIFSLSLLSAREREQSRERENEQVI